MGPQHTTNCPSRVNQDHGISTAALLVARHEEETFVAACPNCGKERERIFAKDPRAYSIPFPFPEDHISLDFITGLIPSQGNTAILVIV